MFKLASLHKYLHSPWLMWFVAVNFAFFQFFLQLSTGVMVGKLIQSLQITAFGAGLLAGAFYLVYILLQTPAGLLVDRFGSRLLLSTGGIICGVGCLLFALSQHFGIAFLARILMGVGSSCAFVSVLKIIGMWFPVNQFAIIFGLTESLGMLITLIDNVYLAKIIENTDWRYAMWVLTFVALSLGLLCFLIVRDKENKQLANKKQNLVTFWRDLHYIFRNAGLWINGLYCGLLFTIIPVFACLWALPYLVISQHVSIAIATFESSLTLVGMAMGTPFMGWLFPRIGSVNNFLRGTAIFSAIITVVVIYFTPQAIWLNSLLFLILGILCSSYVFNFSITNQITSAQTRSASIGFTNMLCMMPTPFLQAMVGLILQQVSQKNFHIEHISYGINHYQWALSVMPVTLIFAALIAKKIPGYETSTVMQEVVTEVS